MNKFFTKIAAAFVGMTMAIGVGVAVGSSQEVTSADAVGDSIYTSGTPSWGTQYAYGEVTLNSVKWYFTNYGNNNSMGWNKAGGEQTGQDFGPIADIDETKKVGGYQTSAPFSNAQKITATVVNSDSVSGTWYVWYSTDSGSNWIEAATETLSSSTTSFTYDHGSKIGDSVLFAFGYGTDKTTKTRIALSGIEVWEAESSTDTRANVALSCDDLNIDINDDPKALSVTATSNESLVEGLDFAFESNDESVVTVDETTGVVTPVSCGSTTIEISFAGDDDYKPANTEITVVVSDKTLLYSTLTFTSACGGSGTADDGASWTVTSDANESTFDSNRGIHYGTSSAAVSYLQLRTDDIDGEIVSVKVCASDGNGTRSMTVVVGETNFQCNSKNSVVVTNSNPSVDYLFTGTSSGLITVRIGDSSVQKALYVKSIVVAYRVFAPVAMSLTAANNKTTITSLSNELQLTAKAFADSEKTQEISKATFTFESASTSVATVNETGLVTPKATGTSVITARTVGTELSATLTITVLYVTVDLVNDGSVLEEGDTGSFTFTWSSESLKPSSPTVVWSSSDNNAIAVEEDGSYLAGDDGASATITVTVTKDGYTYTASREFSVVSSIVAPTHISVTEKEDGVISYVEKNVSLHITVLGAGDVEATNQNVVCTSSDTDILTVTNDGVITPKARGITTVTIVDEGGFCSPVEVAVRVRNVVDLNAKIMGVLTAPSSPTSASDISQYFVAQNNYDAPSTVTQTGGYLDRSYYFRIAAGSSSGSISITYSDLKISKLVVVGKRYGANKADPTISGATADKAFTADDTTVTFTFTDATKTFTLTASSGNQFCCKSITVYGEKPLEADAQACYAFEEKYMHLDDYDTGLHEGVNGDNWCKDTEHNYYQKDDTKDGAKKGFNALSDKQKEMFMTNAAFADAWKRLQNWATANGDALNGDNELAQATRYIPSSIISGENTGLAGLITIISVISGMTICGYFLLRRRKENN